MLFRSLLLLPAAPQVSDEVDPPAEDFATVRAHVGLFRGGLHLTRCLNAAQVGDGEAVLLLCGAPRLVCAVGAELGVLTGSCLTCGTQDLPCTMKDLLLWYMDFLAVVSRLSCSLECRIFVPLPGIKPMSPALEC